MCQFALHGAVGSLKNLDVAAFGTDFVAIGEKQPFGIGRNGFGGDFCQELGIGKLLRVVADTLGFIDGAAHLGEACAFGNPYGYAVGVVLPQPHDDVPRRHLLGKAVAAARQFVVCAHGIGRRHQHIPAENLVFCRQFARHGGNALPFFHGEAVGFAVVFGEEQKCGIDAGKCGGKRK